MLSINHSFIYIRQQLGWFIPTNLFVSDIDETLRSMSTNVFLTAMLPCLQFAQVKFQEGKKTKQNKTKQNIKTAMANFAHRLQCFPYPLD